ncbi:hypothetical protein ABT294_31135 [Nonomuraea sp. NPDC000554]|uniref:hypothetical protein n=1 Tax=Nonomuraea sp. NPDC000554 TaxID=3154259 RepID=UPI00331EEF49
MRWLVSMLVSLLAVAAAGLMWVSGAATAQAATASGQDDQGSIALASVFDDDDFGDDDDDEEDNLRLFKKLETLDLLDEG